MPLTTYTIQTSSVPQGTMTFKLHSSTSGLIVPFNKTISTTSTLLERQQLLAGESELPTMTLDFIEDYTTYSRGFWHYALAATTCEIEILLNEGDGDTVFFYGAVDKENTTIEQTSTITSGYRHVGKITLVSMLSKLFTVTFSDWRTEVATHFTEYDVEDGPDHAKVVTFREYIAAAIKVAYDQTFDADDVVIGKEVIKFDNDQNANPSGLNPDNWVTECLIAMQYSIDGGPYADTIHYSTTTGDTYPYIWDLIRVICNGFCLLPRHIYDASNSRHKIELIGIGAENTTATFLYQPTASEFTLWSGTRADAVIVETLDESAVAYIGISPIEVTAVSATKPTYPDSWIVVEFKCWFDHPDRVMYAEWEDNNDKIYPLTDAEWLDNDGNWNATTVNTTSNEYTECAAARMYNELFKDAKKLCQRTYVPMQAQDGTGFSHTALKPSVWTSINDGNAAADYWAAEIEKDIISNTVTIKWIEA